MFLVLLDAPKSRPFGVSTNEAPGSPAPGMEAEIRKLQEENTRLERKLAGTPYIYMHFPSKLSLTLTYVLI